jgi:CubicO group peptidase (beta-lactamase class C family)
MPTPTPQGLDDFIKGQMKIGLMPGVSITVLRNDQIVWNGAYGTTKPGDSSAPPVTSDTAFMFASLSKTNIAVASMILYEKGLLHPDDDVNKYVNFTVRNPHFPTVPVTLHNLMTHTASISDNQYDDIPIYMPGDPTISLYEVVYNYLAKGGRWTKTGKTWNKKQAPNKQFDYSNIGACLMAYVCEVVAAKNGLATSFDDLVRQHIYVPLGVDISTVGYLAKDLKSLDPPAYAIPSEPSLTGWKNCGDGAWSVMDYPTCDWRSSSLNYARLFGMYMNFGTFQGKQILKKETVEYMQKKSGFSDQGEECSNVFFLYEQNLIKGYDWVLGHDGSDEGITTYAYFDTKSRVGYILLANSNVLDGPANAIGAKLMETFSTDSFAYHETIAQSGRLTEGIRQRHQRRSKSNAQPNGYPGAMDAPGCAGGGDVDSIAFV